MVPLPPAAPRPAAPPPAPPRPPRSFPLRAAVLLLTLSLFGCDHATKIAAHATLAGGRTIPLVDGVVELRYAPNFDTAFSLVRTLGFPPMSGVVLVAASLGLAAVV